MRARPVRLVRLVRLAVLASFALLALPAVTSAQSTPEASVELYAAALRAKDYAAATRLMHPAAVAQIRPLMQLLSQVDSQMGNDGEALLHFFGTTSSAQLAAMPDTVLYARLLERLLRDSEGGDVVTNASFVPLGHVTQPGDTALVVARVTVNVEGTAISTYEVMPMVQWQGAWRHLLQEDISNLIIMLQEQMKQMKGAAEAEEDEE
jgi:hypothetical protein